MSDTELALKLIDTVRRDLDAEAALVQDRVAYALWYIEQLDAPNEHAVAHIRRILTGEYDNQLTRYTKNVSFELSMKHKLAVILVNGDYRIHGAGCQDIPRDDRRSETGAWYIEVATIHEANIACWGDVSTDNYDEGTPEWHRECDSNASMASRFLPCVPSMPKE